MEYQLLFPTFIATMAAFHLIARAAKALRGGTRPTQAPGKRGDWYVFFHCQDLTGERENQNHKEPRQQAERRRGDRKARPALRVE